MLLCKVLYTIDEYLNDKEIGLILYYKCYDIHIYYNNN